VKKTGRKKVIMAALLDRNLPGDARHSRAR
jgi:hypothetical protein